jgi:putative MATE family efflux protein
MGLFAGLRAMVARYVGAGDYETANQAAKQAIVVSAIFSVITAMIGIFFSKQILGIFGLNSDVVEQGAAYLRIQFLGMVAMVFVMMSSSTMQASGDTMTPMKISLVYRVIHVVICPFLVFGWWIFPRMGVSGAALTTVISQSLGGVIGLWILFSGRTRVRLNFRGFRFDSNIVWRIVKIGLPASINSMERSVVGLVMMWFIAPFGTLAVAAHTIMTRIEMVVLMPGIGFGQAAGVLAGQNMGANQPEAAEKSGWLGAGLVEAFMVVSAGAIFLWSPNIVHLFNSEAGVVEIGSTFMMIAAVGYFFMGFAAVLSESLNGVGDTVTPMAAGLITMWGIQVPLAYFLPRWTDLGVYGIRWAMVISLAMRALTYIIYFKAGRWKRKRI